MAKKGTEGKPVKRISEKQRMNYIGFDVFPGKPKDLFKSEAEKSKYVDAVLARREKGDFLRDDCKLFEDRVTFKERLILAVASVVVLAALFLPWYSAYTEIIEEVEPTESEMIAEFALTADSAMLEMVAVLSETSTGELAGESGDVPATGAIDAGGDEIITGHVVKQKAHREYASLTGFGSLLALGSVGSHVFSSGGILMLTGVIFLVYVLLCLGLPALTLYAVFGLKGTNDECALRLKSYLRYNWLPVVLFVLALFLSFFGSGYGAGTVGTFTSIGNSYGVGVFLGTLSWGVYVSMAALTLLAVKGIEI